MAYENSRLQVGGHEVMPLAIPLIPPFNIIKGHSGLARIPPKPKQKQKSLSADPPK